MDYKYYRKNIWDLLLELEIQYNMIVYITNIKKG